jgi:hypothetical protein
VLEKLSRNTATVLHCVVEEASGTCSVCLYHDGQAVWLVLHDRLQGPYHLDIAGDAPEEVDRLYKEIQADQSDKSGHGAFRIPIYLAAHLCGFTHDQEEQQLTFTELMELV